MSLSVDQFVQRLTSSGLMTEVELKQFLGGIPSARQPKDAHGLARELVQNERLTLFQVSTLTKGKSDFLVLGDYVVIDKLGAGAMGEIFKAVRRSDNLVVALKVIQSKALNNQETVQRFHREIAILSKLSHPNIVNALDAGTDNNVHYLVMDFVEGSNLARYVKLNGNLPTSMAVNYIMQAAKGLDYAHKQGVVHRDVKPSNLIVDQRGVIKVLDLGLARLTDSDEAVPLTQSGNVMGTIDYMAPEQAFDTKSVDQRADIYSLGCSLFFLLTGRPVFDGETLIRKAMAHRNSPPPKIHETVPNATEALNRVFQKMLSKTPENRQQSMGEVIGEFAACGYAAEAMPALAVADVGRSIGVAADGSSISSMNVNGASDAMQDSVLSMMEPSLEDASGGTDMRLILISLVMICVIVGAIAYGLL